MRDDLPDHEGYVLAELDREVALYTDDGGRWTASDTQTREAAPIGRHRPACSCGWRGPIVNTGVIDVFLDDRLHDALLVTWEMHTEPLISLAELRRSAERVAWEQDRIVTLVRAARHAGRSWSEIASALGVSKQAAQQRYGAVERVGSANS